MLNEEFAEEWERGERGGPARRMGRRTARQGARRRRRRRRGDLPRRRRGHRRARRRRSVPGSARAATSRPSCCWPAHAPTTAGSPSCAGDSPARRAGVAIVPICRRRRRGRRDPPRARVGAARRDPHPVDVGHLPAVPRPALRPGVGGVRGPVDAGARALRLGRQGRVRPARRHVRHRGAVVVGAPAVVPALVGRVRASSRACGSSSPSAARSGRPTCCGRWTSSTTASTARRSSASSSPRTCRCGRASTSTATAAIGASNTRRRELARRYEIGVGNLMWGNDFPHPEGTWPHTREWLRDAFCDIPRRRDRRDPRRQRGRVLRLRRRRAAAARRPHRPDARRARPARHRPVEVGRRCAPPAARGSPASKPCRCRWRHDGRRPSTRSSPASPTWPYDQYRRLRELDPVHWSELLSGWVLTRYDDVAAVLRDPSMSSDLDNADAVAGRRPRPVARDATRDADGTNARAARRPRPRAAAAR